MLSLCRLANGLKRRVAYTNGCTHPCANLARQIFSVNCMWCDDRRRHSTNSICFSVFTHAVSGFQPLSEYLVERREVCKVMTSLFILRCLCSESRPWYQLYTACFRACTSWSSMRRSLAPLDLSTCGRNRRLQVRHDTPSPS